MSAEAFVWPEGQISIFTGGGAASALMAYAQNIQAQLVWGWANSPKLSGNYVDYLTGMRADVSMGALYTYNATIMKIAQSATAVHIKLMHSSVNGTAGYFLYSGRIDAIQLNGTNANPYVYNVQYHANTWSAFGGG